jgi:hypothetical protein
MALLQPVNIGNIQEWQPLGFTPAIAKMFLALLLVFLLAEIVFRPSYRLGEMALLLFAAFEAYVHLRFIFLFVIFFAPLLAVLLTRWVPAYQASKDRYVLNAALILSVSAGIVALFPPHKELEEVIARGFPQRAVEYLRQHPVSGPMLNDDFWGGYLIRSLGPQQKVFIDGRFDIYEYAGVLGDYLRIVRVDRATPSLLRKYGIKACLIGRNASLGTYLEALPDWEKVYEDDVSVLLARRAETVHKR